MLAGTLTGMAVMVETIVNVEQRDTTEQVPEALREAH